MTIFALKKIDAIRSRQTHEKLIIGGRCQFDEFENSIQSDPRSMKQLAILFRYMELAGDGVSLPDTHFRDITPDGETVKEYEFKTKHLRVYAIKKERGKIIILGGFKNDQDTGIPKFRGIKKAYLNFLKGQNK